jgi:hypothetical protein
MNLDERAFYFLYLNVNSLAELGLLRALRALQAELEGHIGDPEDEAIDLERFMRQVYTSGRRIRSSVARAYLRADRARLAAWLERPCSDLAPLTGRLSGVEMARWLEGYAPGTQSELSELVVEIRSLSE